MSGQGLSSMMRQVLPRRQHSIPFSGFYILPPFPWWPPSLDGGGGGSWGINSGPTLSANFLLHTFVCAVSSARKELGKPLLTFVFCFKHSQFWKPWSYPSLRFFLELRVLCFMQTGAPWGQTWGSVTGQTLAQSSWKTWVRWIRIAHHLVTSEICALLIHMPTFNTP